MDGVCLEAPVQRGTPQESESEAEAEAESEAESESEGEDCGDQICTTLEAFTGSCPADCKSITSCGAGFEPSGSDCVDVNECLEDLDDCALEAMCDNTEGSYTCTCNDGYSGNGQTCVDIDECDLGTDNCGNHATCTNTGGSFACACIDGFSGDGVDCLYSPIEFDTRPTDASWAVSVIDFSSQYSEDRWAASQASDLPDTCTCGDQDTAWAPSIEDGGSESLVLDMTADTPEPVYGIYVHETFGTGSVTRIEVAEALVPEDSDFATVYVGAAEASACDRWVLYPFDERLVASVRLTLDTAPVADDNEIDAVGLKTSTVGICATDNGGCPVDSTCTEEDWGRECVCEDGFVGGNSLCVPGRDPITLDRTPSDVQWADTVLGYSSQYRDADFSAAQATGPANVSTCADSRYAWAPSEPDRTNEWLAVSFDMEAFTLVWGVYIHETLAAGSIVSVDVATTETPEMTCFGSDWNTVWESTEAPTEALCPRWLLVPLPGVSIGAVRLRMNSSTIGSYSEIDAIALKTTDSSDCAASCDEHAACTDDGYHCACDDGYIGSGRVCVPVTTVSESQTAPENVIWADSVIDYSSEYSSTRWSAAQTTGEPNVTICGDDDKAWTTPGPDLGLQWIAVGYPASDQTIYGVVVHETKGVGAIIGVDVAFSTESDVLGELDWHPVYAGTAPSTTCPRFAFYSFTLDGVIAVRLRLDTSVPGYQEIDSIGLVTSP